MDNTALKIQKKTWEAIAFRGNDMIESSGWFNSTDRLPFSKEETSEAINNIFLKLETPYLASNQCSFLEIGCGSGLVLSKLAPYAKIYDAADISEIILEKCRGYTNLDKGAFYCFYAHEVDRLLEEDKKYDVIIMNSIMQYFADYDYAKDVLTKCKALLNNGGVVFCGDVIDNAKSDDIAGFILKNKGTYKRNKDLYYDRSFFNDISAQLNFLSCEISDKIYTIPNEMSLFRYDVMLYG